MTNFKTSAVILALFGTGAIAESNKDQETNHIRHDRKLRPNTPWSKNNNNNAESPNLAVFCDIADDELGFINTKTDDLIQIPFCTIEDWPFCSGETGYVQHTAIDKSGKTIYIGTVSNGNDVPASVIIVTYDNIEWNNDKVSGLRVSDVIKYADADEPSDFDYSIYDAQTKASSQPIVDWVSPAFSHLHGPTFRPGSSNYIYWGTWTNNDFIAINVKKGSITTQEYDESLYAHGFVFNPSGTKAIAPRYWFDTPTVGLFEFNGGSPMPASADEIYLENGDGTFGSFSHYATWWDDQFAFVATMQLGSTPLSGGYEVSGPCIYRIDADTKHATRVAGTAKNKKDQGVWNSGSDAIIANGKLYVSEEQTLDRDGVSNTVGSVGVWIIEKDLSLTWIKRLYSGSGDGIPQDFGVSHGSVVAKVDTHEYVYVLSYASNHIIKIDTDEDKVVKVWDHETDDLNAPHGGFAAGATR